MQMPPYALAILDQATAATDEAVTAIVGDIRETMANTSHAEALAYLTMSLLLQKDPSKVAAVAAAALLMLAGLDE